MSVTAGVLPGHPEPEFGRQWSIGSVEWSAAEAEGADAVGRLLAEKNGAALGYAALLMLQPGRLNWVTLEWVWL